MSFGKFLKINFRVRVRAIWLGLGLGLVLTSFVKAPSRDCQPDFQLSADL